MITDAGNGLDRDQVAVRPEPKNATRHHHEQPGAPFGLVDHEVLHFADAVTICVEHDEPSDVIAVISKADLTLVEQKKMEGERGHGVSSGPGRSIVPGACDHLRPAALQFRDNAEGVGVGVLVRS